MKRRSLNYNILRLVLGLVILTSLTIVFNVWSAINQQATQQLETKIQEATFVISNPLPSVTLKVTKQSGNYHIVGGAFRFPENCDKKLNELKSLGSNNAYKIGTNKYGLHQVAYGSFETRQEAQRELFKIKRTHNKDAWLLIQELDR